MKSCLNIVSTLKLNTLNRTCMLFLDVEAFNFKFTSKLYCFPKVEMFVNQMRWSNFAVKNI